MTDRLDRALLIAAMTIGAAYLILFGFYFSAVMIRRPYMDMFHYIMDYLDYLQTGGFLHYLWSQYLYSEHRQIWMRLLTAVDVGIFRGIAYPFLVVATICVVALPLLMGREIVRAGFPWPLSVLAIWTVVLLVLSTANVADCSIPIEGIYPQTVLFVVLSLILFDGAGEGGRFPVLRRLGAIAAAIGAGLASAVGLLIWPILVWSAWRGQLGWRWIAAVAVVGSVFIALYAHGLMLFGLHAALSGDRQFYSSAHLFKAADAFLTFLGLPWTRAPALAIVGRVFGAGFLLIGLLIVVGRGLLSQRLSRLERIAVGLIIFSLATAAIAALGRVGSEWKGIWPVRYALFNAPLHVGLFCLALPWFKDRWAGSGSRRAIQAAALGFGVLMLVQQIAAGQAGARESQALNAAITEFMASGRDPGMPEILWDNLTQTQHVVDEMRRRQLYLGLE
jgi:hypothetical protein